LCLASAPVKFVDRQSVREHRQNPSLIENNVVIDGQMDDDEQVRGYWQGL
jgi:hypothetical protein